MIQKSINFKNKFENFLKNNFNYKVSKNYKKVLRWSIKNPKNFWSSVWDFSKVKGTKKNKFILTKNPLKNKYLYNFTNLNNKFYQVKYDNSNHSQKRIDNDYCSHRFFLNVFQS